MYTPTSFRMDDPAELRAVMDAARLAILVTAGEGGIAATHLPLMAETTAEGGLRLIGHLARANGQWKGLEPGASALAIFQGPEAYVSPGWYPSKREHGKVVPTWNYVAVHAHGRLEIVEDPAELLPIVTRLTDRHETALHGEAGEARWRVTDAPDAYLAAQLRGIIGVVLTVDRLEGKRKMSQNRPEGDRDGVRAGLSASADPRDWEAAAAMGEG